MAALAFEHSIQSIEYIRLDSATADADGDHALLLDAARTLAGSQTAVLYVFKAEASELNAIAVRPHFETRIKNVGATITAGMSKWIESLARPVQGSPAETPLFERFPEVFQYRLNRLAVIPLRAGDSLLGVLTLGRSADTRFLPQEIEATEKVARLLAAILERDSLQRKLLERKLVERAKGILQQRRRLSEEQAYLVLRDNSRRRGVPMVDLAKEIIEAGFQRDPARSWQVG